MSHPLRDDPRLLVVMPIIGPLWLICLLSAIALYPLIAVMGWALREEEIPSPVELTSVFLPWTWD